MCDIVESVNKISSFIKVNPGKISYNNEKVRIFPSNVLEVNQIKFIASIFRSYVAQYQRQIKPFPASLQF